MANKLVAFLSESKSELKKVAWPSRAEVKGATAVVLTLTFLLAVYIGVVDFFVSKIITFLIK